MPSPVLRKGKLSPPLWWWIHLFKWRRRWEDFRCPPGSPTHPRERIALEIVAYYRPNRPPRTPNQSHSSGTKGEYHGQGQTLVMQRQRTDSRCSAPSPPALAEEFWSVEFAQLARVGKHRRIGAGCCYTVICIVRGAHRGTRCKCGGALESNDTPVSQPSAFLVVTQPDENQPTVLEGVPVPSAVPVPTRSSPKSSIRPAAAASAAKSGHCTSAVVTLNATSTCVCRFPHT